jgi:hypothetical protein
MIWGRLPQLRNKDGTLKHIFKDGSRQHVISYVGVYDSTKPFGIRGERKCSEKECEINKHG